MSLKVKIGLFFGLWNLLLILLVGDLYLIMKNDRTLAELHLKRYESRLLAEELRRSSDELTRMARTYVVTGDPKYFEYFKQIVAIRDGKAIRPADYQDIYWDFVLAGKSFQQNGRQVSIINLMNEMHFSEKELSLLREAKDRSDALIEIEARAFNTMNGFLLDDAGQYGPGGKPDRELALQIVFSEAYHKAKAGIMEKVDEFFQELNARTMQEVKQVEKMKIRYLLFALFITFIMVGMGTVGYWLFHKDISHPLNSLVEWITKMKKGEYSFNAETFNKDEVGILAYTFSDMAEQVATHIDDLEYISRTDPLTKINNRVTLDKTLSDQKYEIERYETPCSIIMVDIDHFKSVNDNFGHAVGDKVLVEIAGIMVNTIRQSDILGRWGGEEFMIICPNIDIEGCRAMAELIRERIENNDFETVGNVTASFGIGMFCKGKSIDETVVAVDESLYKAKKQGRNRVC